LALGFTERKNADGWSARVDATIAGATFRSDGWDIGCHIQYVFSKPVILSCPSRDFLEKDGIPSTREYDGT
jgi:hypothetical protein